MQRHGSETYFIEGEGLLGESLDGRPRTLARAIEQVVPPFRFSRMGPKGTGKQLGEPNRRKIAEAMTVDSTVQGTVPAGFTYLGQFVDHDLSFDETQLMENVDIPPGTIVSARSPRLDLDCLYGVGPQDPGSAVFYTDGLHLKTGAAGGAPGQGFDLARETPGPATIPDRRNDENLAVGQIHLAMIRFHNRVVDTLPPAIPPAQRFQEARKIVTKHYQWMLRTDYLPRICAPSIVTKVFSQGRKIHEVGVAPTSLPKMPIEFAVAAFRLGHSMVRADYRWNKHFEGASLGDLFAFSGLNGGLGPGSPLPSVWIADFRRLFNFGQAGRQDLVVPATKFNRAMKIDTKVVNPLRTLPGNDPVPRNNLAFRNLTRANIVKLATGQQMITFMRNKGLTPTKLTAAQVRDGNGGAELSGLTQAQRNAVVANTPLWFYCLREAEFNNGKLGPVGSRIVAETFHRAMEGSNFSIVRHTAFRPSLGPNNTTFRMVDLLLFAFEGQAALLNPNGD